MPSLCGREHKIMPLHNFPALHNAMWPGLVGKGPDSEPPISLDTMLDLTQAAEVDGVKFDGVDLFLSLPHTDIDSTDDELKRLADDIGQRGLVVGSLVAPVWPPPAADLPWDQRGNVSNSSRRCAGPVRSGKSYAPGAFANMEWCASIPLRVPPIGLRIQRRIPSGSRTLS